MSADDRLPVFFREGPTALSRHVADAVMDDVRRTRQAPPLAARTVVLRFAPLVAAAAAVAVIAAVALAVSWARGPGPDAGASSPAAPSNSRTSSQEPAPSETPSAATTWTGPVRSDDGPVLVDGMSWLYGQGWYERDGDDAQRRYVDITQVNLDVTEYFVGGGEEDGQRGEQLSWQLFLASSPPKAAELDPTETVISYGLTCDRDGDGVADYIVGISNEAPVAGEFRVWVSDLVTGEAQEQVGGPYGHPVEFIHPDEGAVTGDGIPMMHFTFLGSPPEGIDSTTGFYAWASVSVDGEVVAWDYAPDIGWLSSARPNQ